MNNKGTNTVLTIVVTAIVTAMLCYVFFTLGNWNSSLEGNSDVESSSTTQVSSNLPVSTLNDTEMYTKLSNLKKIIDNEFLYDYDKDKLADSTAAGMLLALDDPYATYYNKEQFKSFYMQTEGEYTGIGIYVTFDKVKGMPYVLLPLEGSPALEAGIQAGDYIAYVDELVADANNYEALIDAIKGVPGSKVKIGIIRTDENKKETGLELEVERRKIEINPLTSSIYENNIGYIRMTSFDETSYPNFKAAYEKLLKEDKVKGLIIDLRDNPGGVLGVCVQITDLILPKDKMIVYTVDKKGKKEALYSTDSTAIEVPLIVLVNENSASASEVFTGAIKDYGVGTIIGKKTYGKGVVQTLKSLKDGTYIKLTTSEYFSPNGNKIDKEGIAPDIEVDLPEDVKNSYNLEFEKDTQLQRAIEELKKKI